MATERMTDNVSFEAVSTMAEMEEINMRVQEGKSTDLNYDDSSAHDEGSSYYMPSAGAYNKMTTLKARFVKNQKSSMEWTKMKSPATAVTDALRQLGKDNPGAVACFDRVHRGVPVIKVTSSGAYKQRYLTISHDRCALFVTHEPIYKVNSNNGNNSNNAEDNELLDSTIQGNQLKLPLISKMGIRGVTVKDQDLRDRYVRYIDVADMDGIQLGLVGTQRLEAARGRSGTEKYLKTGSGTTPMDKKADQIVSILHHGHDSLDVLIAEPRDRQELVACLRLMRETYHAVRKNVNPEAQLLRYIWYDVDLNRDGLIGPKEFGKILSRINFHIKRPEKIFRAYAKEVYKKKTGGGWAQGNNQAGGGGLIKKDALTYVEVMNLLQRLKKIHAVDPSGKGAGVTMTDKIWNSTFGADKDVVGVQEFLTKFLHVSQGMKHLTMQDAQEIILTINTMQMNHTEGELQPAQAGDGQRLDPQSQLTRPRFELYLMDAMNCAYDPLARNAELKGPLVQPISQYWINTSHNTYLTGDQLGSASSVEMYLKALRRGCKCLELDCWDGETSRLGRAIPVIFHGHTLTSKILFADVIKAVKCYMVSNPTTYPVILSLENHCSHPYQLTMARILTETLGDLLYIPADYERSGNLPSPEFLRGKCVIKGKRPPDPEHGDDTEDNTEHNDEEDPYEVPEGSVAGGGGSPSVTKNGSVKKPKIVPELARLTLFHGTKLNSFEQSMGEPNSHMHSIGETKIPKIISKKAENSKLWREYNIHHMTRTYPGGKRVDSSNYNPLVAWSVGCQLVALNFQTPDTPLILNDGRFRENNGCGYVLKPKSVMGEDFLSSPSGSKSMASSKKPEPKRSKKPKAAAAAAANGGVGQEDAFDHVMQGLEDVVCGAPEKAAVIEESLEPGDLAKTAAKLAATPKLSERMSSFREHITNRQKTMRLRLRILGGSCLPKPKGSKTGETIDPYVKVTLHDVKGGSNGRATYVMATFSTPAVNDNGFCPVWGDRTLKELTVINPEVAMLQFSLMEQDVDWDDHVAQAAIPCNRLRKGYRSVQLYDTHNTRSGPFGFATLLVEIQCFLDSGTV